MASSKAANARRPRIFEVSREKYLRFPLPPLRDISPSYALVLSFPINTL